MQKLLTSVFIFYKPAIIASNTITLLLLVFGINLFIVLTFKLFLLIFTWYILNKSKEKSIFIFYQNLGIRPWQLMFGTYILDSTFSLLILTIILLL